MQWRLEMAIRQKPEKPTHQQTQDALAFVKKAAVNQTQEEPSIAGDTKKPITLKIWKSELAAIDEAVKALAEKQPFNRKRLKRHAFIIEAIFEKIERVNTLVIQKDVL